MEALYGLTAWGARSFALAASKGYHDGCGGPGAAPHLEPMRIASRLALIHSEVSEALEACVRNDMALRYETDADGNQKPEGFPAELADVFLRLVDLARSTGVDLDAAVTLKHEYNRKRRHMHGGKRI
jgi:NTP pyrophosphatase (non-canonical NTP hydrolase)